MFKLAVDFIDPEYDRTKKLAKFYLTAFTIVTCLLAIVFISSCMPRLAGASEIINVEKLATAIYYAENSKTHPYGILAHYKHTTPRQAAINTIRHALKDWNGKGDFISFLGSRYAPTKNCANDPRGLNKNWVRNVKRLYARAK